MNVRTKTSLVAVTLALALPLLALAEPASFKVNGPHSGVGFTIRHFVSEVEGRFTSFEGMIKYDAANAANDSVSFTVKSASIATDNEGRDKDLRSANYFDVEKYPTLTFTSTAVTKKDDKTIDVAGDFTLHGVTKHLTIPVTILGTAKTPQGEKAGFRASFTIDRKDYGVSSGSPVVGDDVNITIRVEADHQ